jgi:plastocyanin
MIKSRSRGERFLRICLALWLLGAGAVACAQSGERDAAAVVATPAPVAEAKPDAQASPPTALAVIGGQLSLSSGGRRLRSDEAVDAVVYFRPSTPVPVVVPDAAFVISTERKTFVPRVLPIPVGASVRFPNNDPILHNVFSTSKEAQFDLGLYGRSEGEAYRFTQPGVVRIYCNVHHAMTAHVLVMDTPYFARPDAQGRFRLVGVPAGPGELYVWHERSQLWRQAMTAGADVDIQVALELSKRRIPPHLNKSGQPYRRTRPDEY